MAQMNSSLTDVETVFVPDQPGVVVPGLVAWSRRSRRTAATSPGLVPDFVHDGAWSRACGESARPGAESARCVLPLRARGADTMTADLLCPKPEVDP